MHLQANTDMHPDIYIYTYNYNSITITFKNNMCLIIRAKQQVKFITKIQQN